MNNLINEVKKKREFSRIPNSIVSKILENCSVDLLDTEKIKQARIQLRKYFGVFLTNKVIYPKNILDFNLILKTHKSSMKRDYNKLYSCIFEELSNKKFNSIIDLGCGVNGFSYFYIEKFCNKIKYFGFEASGQIVENTNLFFAKNQLLDKCKCLQLDLFDSSTLSNTLENIEEPRLVFMFQIIDALENMEKDFSKKFLLFLLKYADYFVISFPTESLSGKNSFRVRRGWLIDFIKEYFEILKDFEVLGERFLILKGK